MSKHCNLQQELQWLASRLGFRLVPITDTDRTRAALLQRLAQLENEACA